MINNPKNTGTPKKQKTLKIKINYLEKWENIYSQIPKEIISKIIWKKKPLKMKQKNQLENSKNIFKR